MLRFSSFKFIFCGVPSVSRRILCMLRVISCESCSYWYKCVYQYTLCICLGLCASMCYTCFCSFRLQHLSNCWCIRGPALWSVGLCRALSTRYAGWSPIMLGWSQTQPLYWLPGRPSHQPQCYTPLTTSLAQLNPPSLPHRSVWNKKPAMVPVQEQRRNVFLDMYQVVC